MSKHVQYSFQRYESKYLLTPEQQKAIRTALKEHLRPDDYGQYRICNLYYDTPDFQLIRASLEKPTYKEKLRLRSYGVPEDGSPAFVELKKKCHGVVYKRRMAATLAAGEQWLQGGAAPEGSGQIGRELDWFLKRVQPEPKVFLAYDRDAWGDEESLRITFDTNLRYRTDALDLRAGDCGAPLLPPEQILMEVKTPGVFPLWLSHLLSETGAFPTSFSKYGFCYREHLMRRSAAAATTKKGAQDCA